LKNVFFFLVIQPIPSGPAVPGASGIENPAPVWILFVSIIL
jgi:hypothetical protein